MPGMRYQPQGGQQPDPLHPLTASQRFAILPGVHRQFNANGVRAVATGIKQIGVPSGLAGGFGVAGAGSTDKILTTLVGAHPAMRSYYFRARRNGPGGGNLGRLFDKSNGSSGQFLYWSNSSGVLTYGFHINGSEQPIQLPAGSAYAIGASFDVVITQLVGSGFSIYAAYVNGVFIKSQTINGTFTDAPTTAICIGNRNSDNARVWDGLIECAYVWDDRLLTADDAAALYANRYQFFASPEQEESSTAVGGGGSTPVSPAALLLSGGEVGMRVSRRVAVQPTALAVASGSVDLITSRRLPIQAASIQAAGGNVGLKVARRVAVASANLAATGGAVAMRASRRLTVAPVEMAIAGGSILFEYIPSPPAGSYEMPVTPAALTLTGGIVGMRVTRRVSVAPAALTVSAGDVRPLAGRRMAVAAAALQLAAGPVLLRASRLLQVAPAQLVAAGGAVTLRYSQQIEYARAPAGSGYSPQRVEVQARPAQLGGYRPASTQRNNR